MKCKQAIESVTSCGKDCCCFFCEERETCKEVCGDIADGVMSEPEKCPDAIPEGTEMVVFESKAAALIQTIADIASKKKELDEQDKEMRKQLESAMEQYGVKSFENKLVKITYVDPTTKTTVDSAKLKKNYPDIYTECSKVSNVKGSVRITVK